MPNAGINYIKGYGFSGIVLIDASGRNPQFLAEITETDSPSPVSAALISYDIVRRHHLKKNDRIKGRFTIISPYPARVYYINSINGKTLIEPK